METPRRITQPPPASAGRGRGGPLGLAAWLAAGLLLLSALTYACSDEPLPLEPELVPPAQTSEQSGGAGEEGVIGPWNIPTPETNLVGLYWTETSIVIPDTAVRIEVSGFLVASANPAHLAKYGAPPGLPGGDIAGPAGYLGGGFGVDIRIRRPNGTVFNIWLGPQEQTAETVVGYIRGPGTIEASRLVPVGSQSSCTFTPRWFETCEDGNCPDGKCFDAEHSHDFDGQQTIRAIMLEPPVATADREWVMPGDTVNFEVSLPWSDDLYVPIGAQWHWIYDPVTPIRRTWFSGCRYEPQCWTRVWERGYAKVGVSAHGIFMWAQTPIIEIGPPELPKLIVTVDKPKACPGEDVNFRVSTEDESEFQVLDWFWADSVPPMQVASASEEPVLAALEDSPPPIEDCSGLDECTWGFTASGTMTVTAEVEGGTGEGSAGVSAEDVSVDISVTSSGQSPPSFIAGDEILLTATATPERCDPDVTWEVGQEQGYSDDTPLPGSVPDGLESTFTVRRPQAGASRWPLEHSAAQDLAPKQFAYEIFGIFGTLESGQTGETNVVAVRQHEIDVIREEYVELAWVRGVPTFSEFEYHPRCNDVCVNNGDYDHALYNAYFRFQLAGLRASWEAASWRWQENVIYRNPVHNRHHVPGAHPVSYHVDGCAADLQTFPGKQDNRDSNDSLRTVAVDFWRRLARMADGHGFDVEPIGEVVMDEAGKFVVRIEVGKNQSGVGHVHVETDPCPIPPGRSPADGR